MELVIFFIIISLLVGYISLISALSNIRKEDALLKKRDTVSSLMESTHDNENIDKAAQVS